MSRTKEKRNALLNRWAAHKIEEEQENDERVQYRKGVQADNRQRPHTSECHVLADAERYRRHVIRLFMQGVSQIQEAAWGEAKVKELNDKLNRLLREKGHWERRIVELGGIDYRGMRDKRKSGYGNNNNNNNNDNNNNSNKINRNDLDPSEVGGLGGNYLYFGAARDLPGVMEHLEHRKALRVEEKKQAEQANKRSRRELSRIATAEYYGYRDEEDGVLVAAEREHEHNNGVITDAELAKAKKLKMTAYEAMDKPDFQLPPTTEHVKMLLLLKKKEELLRKLADTKQ